MEIESAEDVISVKLRQGDSLTKVPRTHKKLISPELETWWADPIAAIHHIAKQALTTHMEQWFGRIAESNNWFLELIKTSYGQECAGFWFQSEGIRGARIAPIPVKTVLTHLPNELAEFYKLVHFVDWMGYEAGGKLYGPGDHRALSTFEFDFHGDKVELDQSFLFGDSPCGDILFFTIDGKGGWLNHGSHKIKLLGSILDTIDWVFVELLANRCPSCVV